MKNLITESRPSPLTPAGGKLPEFRYIVKNIPLDERPFGLDDLCEEEYIEGQLAELTENGERVVAITRDHEDLMVILRVTAQRGAA